MVARASDNILTVESFFATNALETLLIILGDRLSVPPEERSRNAILVQLRADLHDLGIDGGGFNLADAAEILQARLSARHVAGSIASALEGTTTDTLASRIMSLPVEFFVDLHFCGLTSNAMKVGGISSDIRTDASAVHTRKFFPLLGDVNSPSDLNVTSQEMFDVQSSDIFSQVRAITSWRTPIILGLDLGDPRMQDMVFSLLYAEDDLLHRPFFLECVVPREFYERASNRGFQFVSGTVSEFISQAKSLGRKTKRSQPSSVVSTAGRGSMLLESYTESDRAFFFGRDKQILAAFDLLQFRVSVIYGESGSGKTSLANAGITPAFDESGIACHLIRLGENPSADLDEAFERYHASQDAAILIDQSEEIYTYSEYDIDQRNDFFSTLATMIDGRGRARVIFIIRADFFGRLLRDLESNDLSPVLWQSVDLLETKAAANVLASILEASEITIEPSAASDLIDQLRNEEGTIFPPHLQLGIDYLLRFAARENIRHISSRDVSTAGPLRAALANFVVEQVDQLSKEHRVIARDILTTLVNNDRTKRKIAPEVICAILSGEKRQNAEIMEIIEFLTEKRIVRKVDHFGAPAIELSHEYIIELVGSWVSEAHMARQRAQEYLAQELFAMSRHPNMVISSERYAAINERVHEISIGRQHIQLMLRAACEYQFDLEKWMKKAEGSIDLKDTLISITENGSIKQKHNAGIALLARFANDMNTELVLESVKTRCNPSSVKTAEALGAQKHICVSLDKLWRARFHGSMLSVPEGPFLMGTNDDELKRLFREEEIPTLWIKKETPQHKLELDQFWIDETPVTNAIYEEFDPQHVYAEEQRHHPVTDIDWFMAKEFASWCEKQLPSEAQWEKAARGSDGRRYPWGNQEFVAHTGLANCLEEGVRTTTPVKMFTNGVSPYGCYDMAGNVFEWTDSINSAYPYQQIKTSDESVNRILRGGAWSYNYQLLRCALRYDYYPPRRRGNSIGFRCVF